MSEYHEIIAQQVSPSVADNVVRLLSEALYVQFIDPHYHLRLIEVDPDDNKFVDCAFAAGATYIVSNDHHFDVLQSVEFPKLQVLRLIEFLSLLQKNTN